MWDRRQRSNRRRRKVLIPYSSGMGVGRGLIGSPFPAVRLNTLFVRYGCGTRARLLPRERGGLNTLFVRYGCGTPRTSCVWAGSQVLIPYSSGMGVGPEYSSTERSVVGLNTLFVRYGCGTLATVDDRPVFVLIPYSSGMGVGPTNAGNPGRRAWS